MQFLGIKMCVCFIQLVPVAALSNAWVFRLVTGVVGWNPARGMDACLCVSVLCCPV
jgi:hypothetical protein